MRYMARLNSRTPTTLIRNDLNPKHLRAAKDQGLILINNVSELDNLVSKGTLFKVTDGKGYKIDRLRHSQAVLSGKARNVLAEMGALFAKETSDDASFIVTSMTRTKEAQEHLRKSNGNASKNSSHCYANSFDITYARFYTRERSRLKCQHLLDSVIAEFQKEEKIFVVREKVVRCYHISAR